MSFIQIEFLLIEAEKASLRRWKGFVPLNKVLNNVTAWLKNFHSVNFFSLHKSSELFVLLMTLMLTSDVCTRADGFPPLSQTHTRYWNESVHISRIFLWEQFSIWRQPAWNVNQVEKIEITEFCSRSSFRIHKKQSFFFLCHKKKNTNIKVYSKIYELYDVEECWVFCSRTLDVGE